MAKHLVPLPLQLIKAQWTFVSLSSNVEIVCRSQCIALEIMTQGSHPWYQLECNSCSAYTPQKNPFNYCFSLFNSHIYHRLSANANKNTAEYPLRTIYSEVRRKFPKLLKLDGEALAPQVTFDLNESGRILDTKASFLCDNAGAEVVRQFLDQYFRIFDSDNRQSLLDAYHENSMLSITMPSANQAGSRLNSFWKFNRNLRRLVNSDDHRTRHLKYGRLACVSTLDEWPRTLHERRTFTVDLTIFNTSMMVFTVTGLFKELSGETSTPASMQSYELRHFARTYVVVPQNTGYCIRNETIFITNASQEQVREFKRSQHQPAPGAMASTSTSATATSTQLATGLQGRLNPGGIGAAAGAVAILPAAPLASTSPVNSGSAAVPVAVAPSGTAGMQDENTKMQMIQAMSAQSQMNVLWSRKCLEETNWDYNHAAFVFEQLFKENKIPPEAFVK